ncbi:hypothetical protein OBA45_00930 [bacterium]|nr:hypothetical protein [bacterium]
MCDGAIRVLKKRRQLSSSQYVFEGQRVGHPISNMAILSLMRKRFPDIEAVPHGFRSTFRDWAENQSYSHRAVEYCQAHTVRNKTEAADQRDDLLAIRRNIMVDWESHTIFSKGAEI